MTHGFCCVESQQVQNHVAVGQGCCESAGGDHETPETTSPVCDCDLKKYMERASSTLHVPLSPLMLEADGACLFDLSPWLSKHELEFDSGLAKQSRTADFWAMSRLSEVLQSQPWFQVWMV